MAQRRMGIRRLGKRLGKAARVGSRGLQKGLRLGSRVAAIGAAGATAAGRPDIAVPLAAASEGAGLAHAVLRDTHHAVKSELEKKS